MNEYRLVISGFGKSLAIGSVDKDLHFYWTHNNPEITKIQLFQELYTLEKPESLITDPGDPLYIPKWRDNNDVILASGIYPDSIHVFVYDQNENLIWASDQIEYNVTDVIDQTQLSKGFYLKTCRERKGEFGVAEFSDAEFDSDSLKFQAIVVDSETIVNQFIYKNQILEISPSEFGTVSLNYDFFKIK